MSDSESRDEHHRPAERRRSDAADHDLDPRHGGHNNPGDGRHSQEHAQAGHDAHAGHSPEAFRSKFWVALALTIPVVFWSEHVEMLLGFTAPEIPGSRWIPAVLGAVVFF